MIDPLKKSRLLEEARDALAVVRQSLISRRNSRGHWEGRLSSSALSTATAVSAMAAMLDQVSSEDQVRLRRLIGLGVVYLRAQQNADGGFGDTDRSHSNIATSYLVQAAIALAKRVDKESVRDQHVSAQHVSEQVFSTEADAKLAQYIDSAGGIEGLRKRYGKDKTFVVPILSNLAIAGLLDWKLVPALPFEAAALPQSWYRMARMPVVSYAIPALVAIGQAKHLHCPSRFLPLRMARQCLVSRTLGVLERMQPSSGGYLEATPLTSFVMMSLASTGRGDHPVCARGLSFLEASVREDGSWPIDTNLATWVTSLSIAALSADPDDDHVWCEPELIDWLLSCQHQERHPFTGADPGGWGWTDLSGAVPDGDDTPAAILALRCLRQRCDDSSMKQRIDVAISAGQTWLMRLQNRDGGMPTFCRGWGKLPFDRSSTDLTAHAIRAWSIAEPAARDGVAFGSVTKNALRFLSRSQQPDGSWLPLWFGNQDRADEDNPVYGTAKVLLATGLAADDRSESWALDCGRASEFLVRDQNADGGWGGGPSVTSRYGQESLHRIDREFSKGRKSPVISSTIEETALAVEALVRFKADSLLCSSCNQKQGASMRIDQAIIRGIEFLVLVTQDRLFDVPWPIGFYFAKLWYYEELYPLIYTASALSHFVATFDDGSLTTESN